MGEQQEVHVCESEGCTSESTTPCSLDWMAENPEINHYCWTHAKEHGFCPYCGGFWGGVEYFDFDLGGYGVCENCTDSMKADLGEDDDDDWEYEDDYDD